MPVRADWLAAARADLALPWFRDVRRVLRDLPPADRYLAGDLRDTFPEMVFASRLSFCACGSPLAGAGAGHGLPLNVRETLNAVGRTRRCAFWVDDYGRVWVRSRAALPREDGPWIERLRVWESAHAWSEDAP
jgi:hypothetical protein